MKYLRFCGKLNKNDCKVFTFFHSYVLVFFLKIIPFGYIFKEIEGITLISIKQDKLFNVEKISMTVKRLLIVE